MRLHVSSPGSVEASGKHKSLASSSPLCPQAPRTWYIVVSRCLVYAAGALEGFFYDLIVTNEPLYLPCSNSDFSHLMDTWLGRLWKASCYSPSQFIHVQIRVHVSQTYQIYLRIGKGTDKVPLIKRSLLTHTSKEMSPERVGQ